MGTAVSIRLPDDLAARLSDVASETERSRSFIVQKALESYLAEYADLQIALDRLHDATDELLTPEQMREALAT